jgi:hypothetical protein
MTHIAIHDAVNAVEPLYDAYAFKPHPVRSASTDAAVAAAARNVLIPEISALPFSKNCVSDGVKSVTDDYDAAIAAVPDGPAKSAGIRLGERAAAAIVAMRADDGSDTPLQVADYPQGTEPGEWRFTPDRPFAFAPGWGSVTPFVLKNSDQFDPGPPYRIASSRYTADFNEVKRLGGDGVTTPSARTAEQTEIALFWVESSPLSWNRLARTVAADRGLGLWESARLFALLNMAMSDGYVGSWDTKFEDNFWRPVTAIRLANDDGNPATTADPTWTPLVTTPPIPDHDSGHSVEGGAAAEVLKRVLGTDDVSFSVCSLTVPEGSTCDDPSPVWRSFTSFSQAANENGLSRIYVGFHFRHAVDDGIEHGRHIADRAVNRSLRPRN